MTKSETIVHFLVCRMYDSCKYVQAVSRVGGIYRNFSIKLVIVFSSRYLPMYWIIIQKFKHGRLAINNIT